ncbi:MAG TPA: serine hydrolase [Vicinamibacteria bacterium]|nr:serine hydrolase [Vicinamibacteria bacterium]
MMRRRVLGFLVALVVSAIGAVAQDPIRGFTSESTARQLEIEKAYQAIPESESIREWHRYFTSEPHPATSARTEEIARFIADTWKKQGLEDVVIHRYDVLSSNPRTVQVEMVAPVRYVPSLREDVYQEDPDTANRDVSAAWTSFSASGEVEAPVVYANSGNPADYELLRERGIDPRGKIVVVRYSNPYSYRGFKALTAEREGAAAMIVYSDPAEDGFLQGDVYPDGPWGPESHLQRGGIAYDFIVPGDPLTPGWASTPGAHRIPVDDAVSVPKIMALPMSYRDMHPILEKLGGQRAPDAWQGGLPIEYRLGGEDVRLHVKIDMETKVLPNYVIEGRIRGEGSPDEWVVLGNHHDAWVFGGVDPSSGTASMMEMTKSFGALKERGIRPRRTLVFCSWDGEEVTLTGSTEWGEQFSQELEEKAVAYLNVDSSASGGELSVNAVGSLAPMVVELTKSLEDPSGRSLYEVWRSKPPSPGLAEGSLLDEALVRTRIGSGTDHTVFLNYLGRPVVDMTFDGPYGVYHSVYDDHFWISRIGDPGFRYHQLMSRLWGIMALRLANADILPLDFESYALSLREFVREVEKLDVETRLDWSHLSSSANGFRTESRRLAERIDRALGANAVEPELGRRLNQKLNRVEGKWRHPAGIPGRPWFKHLLYAPKYTYAAMVLPGITEALDQKDWETAEVQVGRLTAAIEDNRALLASVSAELDSFSLPVDSLESKLRRLREGFDGRMAIYVEHVGRSEVVAIDADSIYETFSVIKVPIMVEVLRRVEEKSLSLSQRVPLESGYGRIPSGVLYAFDPGLQPTVKDLLNLMIIVSDNAATDILADLVGRDAITGSMKKLGLARTEIRFSDLDWDREWLSALDEEYRGATGEETLSFPFEEHSSEDVSEAFRRVIEETPLFFGRSTAREIGRLFALLARHELVSQDASALMIDILERQQVNHRLPRYLPDGVRIAHKTGDGEPWVGNDAGILWIDDEPVVVVVFTGHHRGTASELNEAVAQVGKVVADHYIP